MSSNGSAEPASFPYPTQFVYEGAADRFRAAVDVAPAAMDDVTVEAGSNRLRIAVDRGSRADDGQRGDGHAVAADDPWRSDGDPDAAAAGGAVVERTVTPLPEDLEFGDDRRAFYNNGVLTVVLETVERR